MTQVKWNPRNNMISNFNEWDRFLTDFFGDMNVQAQNSSNWNPNVDIQETNDEYIVTADLPGLKKKDINISLKENTLSISGERNVESKDEKKNHYRMERGFGQFNRSFRLPDEILEDKISANFKDGVLTVEIPKAEEVKPKEIEIKVQ
ncbi:MAG: Hsp20/alpha crystallin family protein [Candidatus Marinimicrobia bacterium]|nr:Hsp20/alpha crystallin family protein [Candidatus Neomarinimicrobiota bacterium]